MIKMQQIWSDGELPLQQISDPGSHVDHKLLIIKIKLPFTEQCTQSGYYCVLLLVHVRERTNDALVTMVTYATRRRRRWRQGAHPARAFRACESGRGPRLLHLAIGPDRVLCTHVCTAAVIVQYSGCHLPIRSREDFTARVGGCMCVIQSDNLCYVATLIGTMCTRPKTQLRVITIGIIVQNNEENKLL